jgi:hypothetical protein
MAHTYRDIVYAILDETKTLSDDALLEVEHVIHICHKYRGMSGTDLRRSRELELENRRLRKAVADLTLDIQVLKDVNSKNW